MAGGGGTRESASRVRMGPMDSSRVCGRPGANARAVREPTHCHWPVPEPAFWSPRRCTLSLCVDRQQSHSVLEKEASVSCPPSSKRRDGHPHGSFVGHPNLQATGPGRPTARPRAPAPGLGPAWLPPPHPHTHTPASEPGAVAPPPAAALGLPDDT